MSRLAAVLSAVALLSAGCFGSESTRVAISPDLPPSPSTWPAYPTFSPRSCWSRPSSLRVTRLAPSVPAGARSQIQPAELTRRVLAHLGDDSAIHGIEIGPPPPRNKIRHRFPGIHPPRDSLWAYISAPDAVLKQSRQTSPERIRAYHLAQWEAALVGGALRDEFCSAGGPPLVGWTVSLEPFTGGVSDEIYALNQRFPNPSAKTFRERVADVGRRYGFEPVSIRLLRPRQLAPIVVVRTDRDRRDFIADVGAIMGLLNPKNQRAVTFEGFFFEASDSDGPFVRVTSNFRGEVRGGQWSALGDAYPYEHTQPSRVR